MQMHCYNAEAQLLKDHFHILPSIIREYKSFICNHTQVVDIANKTMWYSDSMDCRSGLIPIAKMMYVVKHTRLPHCDSVLACLNTYVHLSHLTCIFCRNFIEERFHMELNKTMDWTNWRATFCWVRVIINIINHVIQTELLHNQQNPFNSYRASQNRRMAMTVEYLHSRYSKADSTYSSIIGTLQIDLAIPMT